MQVLLYSSLVLITIINSRIFYDHLQAERLCQLSQQSNLSWCSPDCDQVSEEIYVPALIYLYEIYKYKPL